MVKLIAFFKRKPGLSVERFQDHWRTRHAELVLRQPGVRRYVQNHPLPSSYAKREPDYDAVAEAWFDDIQAMVELAPSAETAAARADEVNFIDPASIAMVATEEVVIVDGAVPVGAAKLVAFLRKRPDLSFDHFQQHWREAHGPLAAAIPGNRRYVQCHAWRGIYEAGHTPAYDGIPMSWFEDEDSLRAAAESAEYARTRADEANFLAPGRLPFVVTREVEILK